jgi:regulator of protease activity HflC (stomatin/prohibitin superfamily)
LFGFLVWFFLRCIAGGIYTVNQNERAVKTSFGRAERIPGAFTTSDPISDPLNDEEKQRYKYPQVRVIMPGGPYFKISKCRGRRSTKYLPRPRPSARTL